MKEIITKGLKTEMWMQCESFKEQMSSLVEPGFHGHIWGDSFLRICCFSILDSHKITHNIKSITQLWRSSLFFFLLSHLRFKFNGSISVSLD